MCFIRSHCHLLLLTVLGFWMTAANAQIDKATIPASSTSSLAAYLQRADWLGTDMQLDKQLQVLKEAAVNHPQSSEVLWRQAKCLANQSFDASTKEQKMDLLDRATATAQTAVQLNRTNAHARVTLAVCHGQRALLSGTRERLRLSRLMKSELDQAIALDPEAAMAWHLLGRWEFETASLSGFTRTLAGIVYGNVPEGSMQRAKTALEQAVELEPNRIIHRVELARVCLELDQPTSARQHLESALKQPVSEPADKEARAKAKALLKDLE